MVALSGILSPIRETKLSILTGMENAVTGLHIERNALLVGQRQICLRTEDKTVEEGEDSTGED